MEIIDKRILNNAKDSIYKIAEIIKETDKEKFDILINNWLLIEKLFLNFNINYSWPMSKNHFLSNFDLKKNTVAGQMRRWTKRGILRKGEDYFIEGRGGPTTATYIYENGAMKILERSQSIEGAKFLSKLGVNIHLKKCFLYKNIIKYAAKGFDNPITEFTIANPDFRIDLYLEQSKLPIECDELDHEHESYMARDDREEAIKTKIGCYEFLRFNPHEKNFNIGEVIVSIFYHILGKTINGEDSIRYYNKKRPNSFIRKVLPEINLSDFE